MATNAGFLFVMLLFSIILCSANAGTERNRYIVYMGAKPKEEYNVESAHQSILKEVLEGSSPQESLIHSYGRSFSGFAAWLTGKEKKKLEGMKGVVSVFPSTTLPLHTTDSWDFLGFPTTVKRVPKVEGDIIIGVIDSGIWPEDESFNDKGLGPPPSKWKGTCQNIKCNNKIIGARFYKFDGNFTVDEKSPRDSIGHGTHCASIAAGREVKNTSYFGIVKGIARGATPSARIAVYKACFDGCGGEEILAAFDDAIADGVDVISISTGTTTIVQFDVDAIALGAFHAMQKGILVSASAGNEGPDLRTLANPAPWILTVAASMTNRKIYTNVTLGNNIDLQGISLNAFPTNKSFSPLIYARDATIPKFTGDTRCTPGALDKNKVEGKIVVCIGVDTGDEPLRAGAQGVVWVYDTPEDAAPSVLPATIISSSDMKKVALYLNQTRNPTALIHRSEWSYDLIAPVVATFSCRGPSVESPLVLKPDISAPGVNILGAFSPKAPLVGYTAGQNYALYQVLSGTSQAAPHVAGAAAYVKTFHPAWSPAAVKSALMTTASAMKKVNPAEGEFAFGAGEINPVKAVDPGLVYNTSESDYIVMLCNLGYSTEKVRRMMSPSNNSMFPNEDMICGKKNGTEADLNYPSMTAYVNRKQPFQRNFPRKVTNVGSPNSTYKAIVSTPSTLNVSVTPNVLSFNLLNETREFTVNINGGVFERKTVISASLIWSDGVHSVSSPIVVLIEV